MWKKYEAVARRSLMFRGNEIFSNQNIVFTVLNQICRFRLRTNLHIFSLPHTIYKQKSMQKTKGRKRERRRKSEDRDKNRSDLNEKMDRQIVREGIKSE